MVLDWETLNIPVSKRLGKSLEGRIRRDPEAVSLHSVANAAEADPRHVLRLFTHLALQGFCTLHQELLVADAEGNEVSLGLYGLEDPLPSFPIEDVLPDPIQVDDIYFEVIATFSADLVAA